MRSRARGRPSTATRRMLLAASLLLGLLPSASHQSRSTADRGDPPLQTTTVAAVRRVSPLIGVCGELYGQSVIFDIPTEARDCCGGKPACAHLLGTTTLPPRKHDLRT